MLRQHWYNPTLLPWAIFVISFGISHIIIIVIRVTRATSGTSSLYEKTIVVDAIGPPKPLQGNLIKKMSSLYFLAFERLHLAAVRDDLDDVREILQNRKWSEFEKMQLVESRDVNKYDRTPLMKACRHGNLRVVEFLVEQCGADLFARDSHQLGFMSIHLAAEFGQLDVVRYLCECSFEILEVPDNFKRSPLNVAAFYGKLNIVQYLIDVKGVKIDNKGEMGRTPFISACEQGHTRVVEYLFRRGANFRAKTLNDDLGIHLAAFFGHVSTVAKLLWMRPLFLEMPNATKDTILNRAALGGQLPVVRYLVEEVHANIENRGEYGRTPLLQAADEGHANVVKYLATEAGADLQSRDDRNGDTALHLAAFFNRLKAVDILLQINQKLAKCRNKQNLTPYELAERNHNSEVCRIFRLFKNHHQQQQE